MSEKKFRFCPVCGSMNLKWLQGGNLGNQYKCIECGYQGIAFTGTLKFINSFKKNLLKGDFK